MYKTTNRALILSLAGTLLCGISFAQQSSAPSTTPPATASKPAAAPKAQSAPAAKAGTTPAKKVPATLVLDTPKAKASYAIGMNIGKGLKKDEVDVDPEILSRGMKDAIAGSKSLLTDEEAQTALTALQNDVRKHQQEVQNAAMSKNLKEGDAFLAENRAKPGVVVLPSGLQYKILQPGTGPKPTAADTVVCQYRGTLIDGTEFDSSYKRGQAATFPVGQVIKGWTEALQLMPVGSKWQLFIPPTLGYGDRGTNGGPIGPNQTLIFEVELVSIQPKPEAKPAAAATPEAPQAQPQAQQQAQPQSKPQ
ncbi:MAG: FKBP-type peptidyl-prolyl cis-trans isomerase [Candidatus Acidiferrum sp.]